ncbi:MAG TPA: ATP-binding cassette domain-containing protein [Cytophagaceae bacterium]|jgi:ABC-type multidrug transport system ATPase subunit|nr:ATP-binding cassette domain-containing protein [Cytophagaceae bacterium]
MSEEILKALAQLFAIITKQGGGVTDKERQYVVNKFTQKLDKDSVNEYLAFYDERVGFGKEKKQNREGAVENPAKLTSVKDSVKTLAICKKINETLTQAQKFFVLQELLELIYADKNYNEERKQIIYTVAQTFNVVEEDFQVLEKFVLSEDAMDIDSEKILIIADENRFQKKNKYVKLDEHSKGTYLFMRAPSVDVYLFRYFAEEECTLNGIKVAIGDTVLFSNGSTIKLKSGATFFYSDIVAHFLSEVQDVKLSFNALDIEYRFFNGNVGLTDINVSEDAGKLIGIMGSSGAGKTTLLNVLSGSERPSKGTVCINGLNIYDDKKSVEGLIGYIPQDDLLMEDLTVFENLYFSARLCFGEVSKKDLIERVLKTLGDLGLLHIKDLKVGDPLNKSISGGQRKRLNIALELIREPAVLFVDEPTSGLSSRDSENVIDLLKELTYKGKLIFVVIHQPSSDIYKMFDKFILLDTGGYQIFYGNPIQAISYFKQMARQADSQSGYCVTCGNVNPEQLFDIIEEQVVNEFGVFTGKRKTSPIQWYEAFKEKFSFKPLIDLWNVKINVPKKTSRFKQFLVFVTRDVKAKLSNKQYVVINLLEAPLLGFVLAFIIRYNNTESNSEYIFRKNDNIPAFILMAIVVALFMGLSVSAEEIIKDKKILKREQFLNLSRMSYLFSKVLILFALSALQTALFVGVGNYILEIQGMFWPYWLMLFTVSCGANLIGLNASSTFNSAITVYILIPILLIPQMILSGAMFSFDKINDVVKNKANVPLLADAMISRWAYEGISVYQFTENKFNKRFFKLEQREHIAQFNTVYGIPHLKSGLEQLAEHLIKNKIEKKDINLYYRPAVRFVKDYAKLLKLSKLEYAKLDMVFIEVNQNNIDKLQFYLSQLDEVLNLLYNETAVEKDKLITALDKKYGEGYTLKLKDEYYNENLAEYVRNVNNAQKADVYKGYLIPKTEYIYFAPVYSQGVLDYRTHFFSPVKVMFKHSFGTYWFNVFAIWFMVLIMFIMLYFDFYARIFDGFKKLEKIINK